MPGHRRPSVTFNPTLLEVVPESQESLPASPVHHKGSLPNILEEETRVLEETRVTEELEMEKENEEEREGGGGRKRKHGVVYLRQLSRNSISEMRM